MVVPIILAGVGAVAGALQNKQEVENQRAIRDFQVDQFRAVKESALISWIETGTQQRTQTVQQRASVAEDIRDLALDSLAQLGAQRVSAGAGNVGGRTVQELQADTVARADSIESRLERSQTFREVQAEFQMRARARQTADRIRSALPGATQSIGSPFMDILGGAAAGYSLGSNLEGAFNLGQGPPSSTVPDPTSPAPTNDPRLDLPT